MNKYNYYYDEYYKDISDIASRYKNLANILKPKIIQKTH